MSRAEVCLIEPAAWDAYYERGDRPWDVGGVTPALIAWAKTAELRKRAVLVPGCGSGHDAHFLQGRGAEVVAVDYSSAALIHARATYPHSKVNWVQADVTQMTLKRSFDLIWEYTCFCALQPEMRTAYLTRLAAHLAPSGRYFGMVFLQVPNPQEGPPFEIESGAFRELLAQHFEILAFEPWTERSLSARKGKEIWFEASALG